MLPHPPFRDDLTVLYVRQETLRDPAKAAALKAYVSLWARAAEWVRGHPDEFAELYYAKDQGLTPADARYVVSTGGEPDIPRDWSAAVGMEQAAADVMARQTRRPAIVADSLFDHRFQALAADAADAEWAAEGHAPSPRLAANARGSQP